MTYAEKIKELHDYSKSLMVEYRIIAREINTYLRTGTPVEQDLIRLQDTKQREFSESVTKHNKLITLVVSRRVRFNDTYQENP